MTDACVARKFTDTPTNAPHFVLARRYGTETVSHDVLQRMKQLMVDNNTAASHSFLLDDDSSIPFSLDDIAALMEDKVCSRARPRAPRLRLQDNSSCVCDGLPP